VVRVSASVATAEKLSMVLEIMLQPIKEISGAITLPGSKSLSNRILLLAALSEVYNHCVLVGNSSFLTV
jgi:3-phosphoshikimate 1-carboxyvinyltransferase